MLNLCITLKLMIINPFGSTPGTSRPHRQDGGDAASQGQQVAGHASIRSPSVPCSTPSSCHQGARHGRLTTRKAKGVAATHTSQAREASAKRIDSPKSAARSRFRSGNPAEAAGLSRSASTSASTAWVDSSESRDSPRACGLWPMRSCQTPATPAS